MITEELVEETITKKNIDSYKELIDSIRYICDFNGFDKNFDYKEDVLNPSIPEGGVAENNHFVGFKFKSSGEPCVYIQFYEKFMDDKTVFLGDFYENRKFHGQGYGTKVYEVFEDSMRNKGYTKIVLNVDLNNTAAVLFWIKMGFKNIDFSFVCNEVNGKKYYMLRLKKVLINK